MILGVARRALQYVPSHRYTYTGVSIFTASLLEQKLQTKNGIPKKFPAGQTQLTEETTRLVQTLLDLRQNHASQLVLSVLYQD